MLDPRRCALRRARVRCPAVPDLSCSNPVHALSIVAAVDHVRPPVSKAIAAVVTVRLCEAEVLVRAPLHPLPVASIQQRFDRLLPRRYRTGVSILERNRHTVLRQPPYVRFSQEAA